MPDPYLVTREGVDLLRARVDEFRKEKIKNAQDIERARSLGDLSENAEYHAAKERQGQLYAMLADMEGKLGRAQIVDTASLPTDRVRFGSLVTVLDVARDAETSFQIVGEDEADAERGRLSYKSPMAAAFIGKEEGDEVQVRAPGGVRTYEVVKISRR